MYSPVVRGSVPCASVMFSWFTVFQVLCFLLTFCLVVPSITESGVSKSPPSSVVHRSVSPFICVSVYFIYFEALFSIYNVLLCLL